MLDSMVKQAMSCGVHYYQGDAWQEVLVESQVQIMELRHMFARYVFESFAKPRLPEGAMAGGSTVAVFTCCPDRMLQSEIVQAEGRGASVHVICPEVPAHGIGCPAWVVNEAYDFHMV